MVIQNDLRSVLKLEQGTPVGIGSGKASLKYKMRACVHSVKLTAQSWMRACEQMCRTATWVGDLGESGVVKVKTNLKKLMGDWVMHADAQAEGEQAFDMAEDRCFLMLDGRHGHSAMSADMVSWSFDRHEIAHRIRGLGDERVCRRTRVTS